MDWYSKKVLTICIVGFFATVVLLAGFFTFAPTDSVMAWKGACFPKYPTCTTGKNSWDNKNVTCRCEKLPEAP